MSVWPTAGSLPLIREMTHLGPASAAGQDHLERWRVGSEVRRRPYEQWESKLPLVERGERGRAPLRMRESRPRAAGPSVPSARIPRLSRIHRACAQSGPASVLTVLTIGSSRRAHSSTESPDVQELFDNGPNRRAHSNSSRPTLRRLSSFHTFKVSGAASPRRSKTGVTL
jgi:hypothetical protein